MTLFTCLVPYRQSADRNILLTQRSHNMLRLLDQIHLSTQVIHRWASIFDRELGFIGSIECWSGSPSDKSSLFPTWDRGIEAFNDAMSSSTKLEGIGAVAAVEAFSGRKSSYTKLADVVEIRTVAAAEAVAAFSSLLSKFKLVRRRISLLLPVGI